MAKGRNEDVVVKNDQIASEYVRLAGENGLERLKTSIAIDIARDRGEDLVVVSANGEDPIVKIMDYGKYKFDRDKKQKELKKKQKVKKTKEIKMGPHIRERDRDVKVGHGIRFLSKGHKVKVTLSFSGREEAHESLGWDVIESVRDALVPEYGTIESEPVKDGRNIYMMLAPK